MTVRSTLFGNSDKVEATPWVNMPIESANLITSKQERYPYGTEYHRPVLDLDFEAELVPSSTPGHYHLYLDRLLTKANYMKLLVALADAGIIQQGFADASIERGASSARLPWIKKDDWAANQADPEASLEKIQNEIREHEQALANLRKQLDLADPW